MTTEGTLMREKKGAATVAAAETKARVWGVWVVVPTTLPENTQGLERTGVVGREGLCSQEFSVCYLNLKTFWPKKPRFKLFTA